MDPPAGSVEPDRSGGTGSAPDTRYVGLATRTIAFALDAGLINLVAVIVGVGASLILSLLHLPGTLRTILAAAGGAAYICWAVGYFVVFWSTTGQTPGARMMQFRVLPVGDEQVLKPRRALLRCAGILLAALPLFAGFVRILFDSRRRGFHDRLAGTVVVNAPQLGVAATRRASIRAAHAASGRPPTTPPAMGP